MEITAKARFVRMSPRKVRLVVDVVRGMPALRALTQLKFMNKDAALPVYKLIASAIANAEHNFKLSGQNLRVSKIFADGGPVLHRWKPKAFGRAGAIRKPTTHISVILSDEKLGKTGSVKEEAMETAEKSAKSIQVVVPPKKTIKKALARKKTTK